MLFLSLIFIVAIITFAFGVHRNVSHVMAIFYDANPEPTQRLNAIVTYKKHSYSALFFLSVLAALVLFFVLPSMKSIHDWLGLDIFIFLLLLLLAHVYFCVIYMHILLLQNKSE